MVLIREVKVASLRRASALLYGVGVAVFSERRLEFFGQVTVVLFREF